MSETRKLSSQICLRLPPETDILLTQKANSLDMSKACFIRELAIEHFEADPKEYRLTPKRGKLPDIDLVEIGRLRNSLAQLTGALVQSAIRTKEDGLTDLKTDIEHVLVDLKSEGLELTRIIAKLRGKGK